MVNFSGRYHVKKPRHFDPFGPTRSPPFGRNMIDPFGPNSITHLLQVLLEIFLCRFEHPSPGVAW